MSSIFHEKSIMERLPSSPIARYRALPASFCINLKEKFLRPKTIERWIGALKKTTPQV